MESNQFFELLRSFAEQLPSYLALLAGIIFAITRWKQHPKVAMVVVIALGFLLFHQVIFTLVYTFVPSWIIRSYVGSEALRKVLGRVYLVLGLISNGTAAIGFGALLAAIFMRRNTEPISET